MRVLILDDEKARHIGFRRHYIGSVTVHVWTVAEAIEALKGPDRFDIAQLDHDLQSIERSGHDVAAYIATMPEDRRPKKIIIHSFNPAGAARMHATLTAAGVRDVVRIPYEKPS